jgi:hypothetical protein
MTDDDRGARTPAGHDLTSEPEFGVFDAVCGAQGYHGFCCSAQAPVSAVVPGVCLSDDPDPAVRVGWLPCTRRPDHPGDHVAAHIGGRVLARWKKGGT